MQTVTICGVGLIGGSFALALRKAGFGGTILGVSSQRSIAAALERGVIDQGVPAEEGIARADLIYLSQPISHILEFLPLVAAHKRADSLVTDAGSTKAVIMRRALELMPAASVLGGHPMAGKEVRGVQAAEASLFDGRTYILTPSVDEALHHPVAISMIEFLARFGARLLIMPPERHDSTVAVTSHLCQIASTALSCTVADGITSTQDLGSAGPALREMTRIALSSYDLWHDIIETNREPIESAIGSLILHLEEIRQDLGSEKLRNHFGKGAGLARAVRQDSPLES